MAAAADPQHRARGVDPARGVGHAHEAEQREQLLGGQRLLGDDELKGGDEDLRPGRDPDARGLRQRARVLAGEPDLGATLVDLGESDDLEFIAFWLSGGRVVGGMNVNVWDVTDDIQSLIRSNRTLDPARLADPSIPLSDI